MQDHRHTAARALLGTALIIALAVGRSASAGVFVNELLGSTASEDCEFIELFNPSGKEVDLTGWTIELWDSDAERTFGTHDADSPIRLRGRIDAGGFFLLANAEFTEHYEIKPDQPMRANGIENSSYTLVLKDDLGEIVETIFVTDGDEGDTANINGRAFEPDAVIKGDGRNIPPGFARMADANGKRIYRLLKFSPVPAPGATPGTPNKAGPDTPSKPVSEKP